MKKIAVIFCLAMIFTVLAFCRSANAYQYYKMGPTNTTFNNLWPLRDRQNAALKKLADFYTEILSKTSTPQDPVYLDLGKALDSAKKDQDAWNSKVNDLGDIRNKMLALLGGKDQITSDQPGWKDFLKLNDDLNKGFADLNKIGKTVASDSQTFVNLANSKGVKMSPIKALQDKIQASLANLDRALADARKKTGEAHEYFNKLAASPDLTEKKKALDEMDRLINLIEQKRKNITAEVDLFNKESAKAAKLYQGPGIPKITIWEELKAQADEINDLSHKFNDQSGKLNIKK